MEPESSFTGNRHWLYFELDECGRNTQTLFLSFILIFSYLLLELQSDILWLGYMYLHQTDRTAFYYV